MPKKFRCVNQSVLSNARQLMNAGIIPKPSWYDGAMAARPFPGALKGGIPPKQIIFKSDWILRRFYKRFPWATAHEIHATRPEETISPGAQFATKVESLIDEGMWVACMRRDVSSFCSHPQFRHMNRD